MHIFYVHSINSTQDHAKALSDLHLSAVSFWVQSATQTKGRGQRGRKWESDLGNLYLTGCFFKQTTIPGQLSIAVGVLISNILKARLLNTELKIGIKWPNDLLISGRKYGGILIEMEENIYVGIGINLSSHPENHLAAMPAAHLPTVSRDWLMKKIIENIDDQFLEIQDFNVIQQLWWSFAKDCVNDWRLREPINGDVIGIDSLGQLLIKTADGKITARHQTFTS
jgi:BirA family biotin operon repressor/biotin-[acetyl-CoA-carboxylase] ligase